MEDYRQEFRSMCLLAEAWDSFHFPGDSQLAGRKSVGVVGSGVEQ